MHTLPGTRSSLKLARFWPRIPRSIIRLFFFFVSLFHRPANGFQAKLEDSKTCRASHDNPKHCQLLLPLIAQLLTDWLTGWLVCSPLDLKLSRFTAPLGVGGGGVCVYGGVFYKEEAISVVLTPQNLSLWSSGFHRSILHDGELKCWRLSEEMTVGESQDGGRKVIFWSFKGLLFHGKLKSYYKDYMAANNVRQISI